MSISTDSRYNLQRKEKKIMKKTIFKGMATAIVTPMTKTDIDYEALGPVHRFPD